MINGIYKYQNMNKIKIIKTEEEYNQALESARELMLEDPHPDSKKGEQLSLLTRLIKDYEARIISEYAPGPIEAIKFRMEQKDLKPADLIPYLGSRSRVSEVLSGKRSLTLDMIRALEEGLGIPAKSLIKKPESENVFNEEDYKNWDNRLINEMKKQGYFNRKDLEKKDKNILLKNFFSQFQTSFSLPVMARKSHYSSNHLVDKRAFLAWVFKVKQEAQKAKPDNKYKDGVISVEFMRNLAKLSLQEYGGVKSVQEELKKYGIVLIIEPHLSKTRLDGGLILDNKENPVIGLTLRHDRLDNFWFSLMYELAHLALHFNEDIEFFYDEVEGGNKKDNQKEKEADKMAQEALLPQTKWETSPAKLIPSPMAAQSLANELGIHVAIVAGQIRFRHNNYACLSKIIKKYKVRDYFFNNK